MEMHLQLVYYAKTYGLIYFMALSACVVAYAFWPSNKSKFNAAANQILDDKDQPCL